MRKGWLAAPDLWADLAAVGAAVWMGLHVLRGYVGLLGFVVGAALTFNQTVGLLFAVWCLGIVGSFVAPRLGGARPARRLGMMFAYIYALGHLFSGPVLSPVLAALAVISWLWLLPALAGALGRLGRASRIAPGILLGLAAQIALQTATHGLDLPLLRGPGAAVLALLPILALGAGFTWGAAGADIPPTTVDANTPGWGLVALSPYLVLQMVLLSNVSQVAIWTGWGFTQAAGLVLLGLAAGCAAMALAPSYPVRALAAVAAVALLLRPAAFAGGGVWLLVAAQACLSLALPAALHPHRTRLELVTAVAALLFFGIYFEYHTKPGWTALWPLMAGLAVLPAVLPLKLQRPAGAPRALAALVLAGLAGIGIGAVPYSGARPSSDPLPGQFRVMTYNIHEGYAGNGVPNAPAMADVIESAAPDLAGLQEVARGLDVLGGADLYAYLQWRLPGYHVLYGPANGDRQGNVLLSRYPVVEHGSMRYPKVVSGEQRELMWAHIATADGSDLLFGVTHFSAWDDEEPDRLEQAADLLAFWHGRPRTLIAGDLNQTPDGQAIQRLDAGGLTDLSAAAGLGSRPTFPAGRPRQRIDYLWGSPDLTGARGLIPETQASDHRPVLITVTLH